MALLHNGKPRPGAKLAQMDGGINRSCVGAWLFGEQNGRYADSSKSANHIVMTDNGGSDPTNLARRAPGRLGGIAYRGLSTKRSVLVSQKAFVPPNGSWTISFWVNMLDWHDYGPLASQWDDGPSTNKRSWGIFVFSDGTVHAYSSSNGTLFRQYGTSATLPLRTWTHVAVVYPAPGGTPLIYFNGVAQSTPTTAGNEAYNGTSNQNLSIYWAYVQFFASTSSYSQACLLEAARIDTRILSSDEILWLYRNQFGAWQRDRPKPRYRAVTSVDHTLIAARGSFTHSGQAAGPTLTGKIAAVRGSYALSGQTASPKLNTTFANLFPGSFATTGREAELEGVKHWRPIASSKSPWTHDECDCK